MRHLHRIVFVALLLAGCAGEKEAREAASSSARMLNELKASSGKFVSAQNELNDANAEELNRLKRLALVYRSRSDQTVSAWKAAGDKESVDAFSALATPSASDVLGTDLSLRTLAKPGAPSIKSAVEPKAFDEIVKALTNLAEKQSLIDRAKFLVDYGEKVKKEYEASLKAAADQSERTSLKNAVDESVADTDRADPSPR
jgi:hypothetical protein